MCTGGQGFRGLINNGKAQSAQPASMAIGPNARRRSMSSLLTSDAAATTPPPSAAGSTLLGG